MVALVWIGAALTVIGFAGLVWSIVQVARARREALPDEELRDRVRRALPLNLGSLFVSFLGLMLVLVGVILAG
ncbi:hypothetical protein [Wenxinia marina]|uniref:Uncharacterized protein n=1 Tax=Wenxinia marina DSM 24838 TaxID=1123501 RepID=A0A0D0NKG9_9RHOB|nr:hypothetical protein [Wenxinia marina]KIQ68810.1 hypothetical protein Wenmar_02538 [Wenxinia marina DSM 24838]GGL65079.1 hypothetical protein GCM10011392_19620 [Wenxinia marina]